MTAGFGLKAIFGPRAQPKAGRCVCGSAPGMASGWRMTKSPLQPPGCSRKAVIYCSSVSAVPRRPPALIQPPSLAGSQGCARLLPSPRLQGWNHRPSCPVSEPGRAGNPSLWIHGAGMAFLPSQAGQNLGALGCWRCWGWSNSKCGRISTWWCCCAVKNLSKPFQALPWLCLVGRTGWAAARD